MNIRQTNHGFTVIEILITTALISILCVVSGYLFVISLRAWDSSLERTGIREDMNFAMGKIVRDLQETAQGSLGQYSSIAHTIQYTDLSGDTYAFYLYNAADTTFDSTYGESLYDLRKANIIGGGGWTQIIYDEFESDFGNWTDGGEDCLRYTGGTYAHQGSAAVNLQDDTSTSVVTTSNLSLSSYDDVKVEFWYRTEGLDKEQYEFLLEISTNGGSVYDTVQSWAWNIDFQNSIFYQESVTITGYTLTDQTRIRFSSDFQRGSEDVYIDEIRVSAMEVAGGDSPDNGEGTLILRDLVSPDATEPATDLTISGDEATLDLVVQRGDATVTMRTKVRPRNL